jgi:hypothetical protein
MPGLTLEKFDVLSEENLKRILREKTIKQALQRSVHMMKRPLCLIPPLGNPLDQGAQDVPNPMETTAPALRNPVLSQETW